MSMIASEATNHGVSRGHRTMLWARRLSGGALLAGFLTAGMGFAPAQSSAASPLAAAIEREATAIHAAERKGLPDEKLGAMWGVLGSFYQDAAEYEKAERAYTNALHLLRTSRQAMSPAGMANYAIVLDDLGSIYLETGRLEESENTRRNALSVRRELGEPRAVAVSQGHLAEVELARHRFDDAARDARAAAEGLAAADGIDLNAAPSPAAARGGDASDRVAALVTLSYALDSEKRCAEGLAAAQQALQLAEAAFPPDTPPVGHVLMALGLAQWRMRAIAAAEQSMRDGFRILKQHLAPMSPVLASALMEYRGLLKSQKRDTEIAALDAEMEAMRRGAAAQCVNCTVSAYGLMHAAK